MRVAAAVVCFALGATLAQACIPLVEHDFTLREIGGYLHISDNNQLRKPGEPQRFHSHYLVIGSRCFYVNDKADELVGIILISTIVLSFCVSRVPLSDSRFKCPSPPSRR